MRETQTFHLSPNFKKTFPHCPALKRATAATFAMQKGAPGKGV